MSKITYHTFYTENIPDFIVDMHKEICKKFDVNVKYHTEKLTEASESDPFPGYRMHGEFMDHILNTSDDEIIAFLDIDCLPLNKHDFSMPEDYVKQTKSFCGNAQNISHGRNRNVIYAAPSYIILHKEVWNLLGKPSFKYRFMQNPQLPKETLQVDTAMEITLRANVVGQDYQLFLPTGYSIPPENVDGGQPMKLGPYGWYGIGTYYPTTWHLIRVSESHKNEEIRNLWIQTCNDILDGVKAQPNYKFYPHRLFNYL